MSDIAKLVDAFVAGRMSRRELIASLSGALAIAAAGRSAPAAAQETGATFRAVGLNHIALRVPDVQRSSEFYKRHLGMTVASESSSSVFLNFDDGFLALFQGEPARMDHYCYSIEDYDVQDAAEKLRAQGIEPRITGQRIYFPDADGLTVQLSSVEHRA